MTDKNFLSRREAAQFLSARGFTTSSRTLEKTASAGGGPTYRIYGRRALYEPGDLLEWAESRCSAPRRHTSELAR